MKNVLLIGGRTGIGQALGQALSSSCCIYSSSQTWETHLENKRICMDICDEESIIAASAACADNELTFDAVINCAGILHMPGNRPEKAIKGLNAAYAQTLFQVNALGHLLVLKHFKPLIIKAANPLLVSLSARIGSIEDNRLGGWYSYRMSKAALNMGLKTLAIEWRRDNPKCSALLVHPGTTDTSLSKPFQKGLPAGQLQSPQEAAEKVAQVILKHWNASEKSLVSFQDHHGVSITW